MEQINERHIPKWQVQNTNQQPPNPSLPSGTGESCNSQTGATPPQVKPTNQAIYQALHPREKKRRATNKAIRRLCKETGCFFMETWRCTELRDRSLDINMFADDGLHLSTQGINALARYIEGNASCLLDQKKRVRRVKIPR
jgi:hypothetical protein